MERNEEGLQSLGSATKYRMDYAPEVLETFENKHQDNDYWVRFNCRNLRVCVLLRGNQTLQKFVYHTSPMYVW